MNEFMEREPEAFDMEYEDEQECYEWEESDFQLEMDYNPYMGQYEFEYDMEF